MKILRSGVKLILLASALVVGAAGAWQGSSASPTIANGTVEHHLQFQSKYVAPRNVEVWLPPGYEKNARKYPVLYMHDGQNVFNPATAYGGVEWGVDEVMTELMAAGKIRPAIVVGIWNTPKRFQEYMPQKALTSSTSVAGVPGASSDPIVSDQYLKFVVDELKPFIDSRYRTLRDRKNTFVMGSSMGGLISAYAISEYPEVFGGAGCVSTHWPAGNGSVIEYLKRHLPDPRTHRIYFDYGTATLDSTYEPFQKRMDEVMKARGFREGKNWITLKFEGAEHSERWWRARLDRPLTFLLGT